VVEGVLSTGQVLGDEGGRREEKEGRERNPKPSRQRPLSQRQSFPRSTACAQRQSGVEAGLLPAAAALPTHRTCQPH
jgi:hypothetical protein